MKNNIKKLRKSKGIKQMQLAQKLGVSCVTLSKYENFKNSPKLGHIKILMAELDCQFCELFN